MTSVNLEIIPSLFSIAKDFDYSPSGGEVIILAATIPNGTSLDINVLSSEEQERARLLLVSEVRDRYVMGRRILRETLAPWFGLEPASIELGIKEGGKPYLKQDPSLHLSLSHSGDLLMAGFSRLEIGIDLERQRDVETVELAQRFFSCEEAEYLAKVRDAKDDPKGLFFHLWTCREAAIKADGRGLGALLTSTRVIPPYLIDGFDSRSLELLRVMIGNDLWQVIPWRLRGGYHAALALRQLPTLIHWRDLR